MQYQVRVVEDTDLPNGVEWAWARVVEGLYLFVTRSAVAAPGHASFVLTCAITARFALEGDPMVFAAVAS